MNFPNWKKLLSPAKALWNNYGANIWARIQEDRVTSLSAQLSFYFILSVFPLLLALTSLLGLVLQSDSALHDGLQKYLRSVAPESVAKVLGDTLREVTSSSSAGKLSFGLVFTLWTASLGMVGLIDSLNRVYDVQEARPWWRQRMVALVLTVAFLSLVITALVLVVFGARWGGALADRFGLGGTFVYLWGVGQWLLILGCIVLAFNTVYVYAPNVKHRTWKWFMPGTVTGIGLWLAVSYGFKIYLTYFNSYSATYGSIGAVIILLLWFYFTGIAVLVGAEVNCEVEERSQAPPEQAE